MIREVVEKIQEAQKFHPIDTFMKRWVISDGKVILDPETGETVTIPEYKKKMKTIKRYDQYDTIFFPSEKLAKEAFIDAFGKDGYGDFEVKELSYA